MDTEIISVILSAIIALTACIAVWYTTRHAHKIARRERTLVFIEQYNSNKQVLLAFRFIKAVAALSFDEKVKRYQVNDNRDNFLFLMNKFENLSIGLEYGVYDKTLVQKLFGRDLSLIYDNSRELIKYIRAEEDDDKAFSEFEKLAKKVEQRDASR